MSLPSPHTDHPSDALGLVRHPGQRDRFVLTDNLTGWFEGFTHASTLGRGYLVRDAFVWQGWSTTVNGRPLDRDFKAVTDTVLPWGHRVTYPGVTEEVLLHSGRRVLSLRVSTTQPSQLEIQPRWVSPFPKTLRRGTVVRQTPTSLTVHCVFGETPEELRANQDYAKTVDVWQAEVDRRWSALTETWIITDDDEFNTALFWAQASARSLVVQEFGTGIWAGLPWFKDNWGRDTFIALPGTLLATGQFAQARDVLDTFARYQNLEASDANYGRIPNRVTSTEILYNTVDGTPWLIRELWEYARCTGDVRFALGHRPLIRRYVDGALKNFVDADGLLTHDDADTWMDARIEGTTPWSPRGPRAVEIQVLWLTALEVGALLADRDGDGSEAAYYRAHHERARASFLRLFVHGGLLVDRLDDEGRPDARVRPNALMALSIPFRPLVDDDLARRLTQHTVETLLLPYGVLSLDPAHPDFHPYHEHPVSWHKDAAYHNGTIWGWNAGPAIAALTRCGWADHAWALTRQLADQILHLGTVGTMSELLDAAPAGWGLHVDTDEPDSGTDLAPEGTDLAPVPSGTFSQAWSVSEFVRSAWQDFLGFRPHLVDDELVFEPHLPRAWTDVRARASLGAGRVLGIAVTQLENDGVVVQDWVWTGSAAFPPVVIDGQRLEWKGTELAFHRELPPPPPSPSWASLPAQAGSSVLDGQDVLQKRLRPSPHS